MIRISLIPTYCHDEASATGRVRAIQNILTLIYGQIDSLIGIVDSA